MKHEIILTIATNRKEIDDIVRRHYEYYLDHLIRQGMWMGPVSKYGFFMLLTNDLYRFLAEKNSASKESVILAIKTKDLLHLIGGNGRMMYHE